MLPVQFLYEEKIEPRAQSGTAAPRRAMPEIIDMKKGCVALRAELHEYDVEAGR